MKFKKPDYLASKKNENNLPDGVWIKCEHCGQMLIKEDVITNKYVCYKCGHYFRLRAKTRIKLVCDQGTFTEWDKDVKQKDPLKFPGYLDKLDNLKTKLKLNDAVITGKAAINGKACAICACDGRFMMGSMGYVVGEKITRAIKQATNEKLPIVIFACSGGARMQEGMISLMQMAKTSAALKEHSDAGLFYLSVLTDPTTGGVTASFAMLGDIILAEPDALVGFAGPRVIEQTIGEKLPEGFQRAEFLVNHGLIDGIIKRQNMKETIAKLISLHEHKSIDQKLVEKDIKINGKSSVSPAQIKASLPKNEWDRVLISRSNDRPTALDYIDNIFDDFYELKGDRRAYDDKAIVGGLAYLYGKPVTVIAHQKGRNTKENIKRNFGMPQPEGYVKALRLMKQAEKFNRPIITFIDTPGAFPGKTSEEHGQGQAIANNLFEMANLKVPVLSIVIGEGGSGGALALGVANEVWMMENATYSILSPEGFASILWKDASLASEAAKVMKMTAADLHKLGIVEKVIKEDFPACELNLKEISYNMASSISDFLDKYEDEDPDIIASKRLERFYSY